MKNKFCEKSALRNESDVEQFFVARLLKDLGYKDTNILTKHAIPARAIGKGQRRHGHVPDYQMRIGKTPVLIVEAKHPNEPIEKYITEAQDYAAIVNRDFIGKNPIRYAVATNGIKTKLVKVDESKALLELNFEDFESGNAKYKKLHEHVSFESIKKSPAITKEEVFEFRTPDLVELKGVFKQAHDLIRRKQKIGPKKAFYEFTKLLFIKMNEDKNIQDKFDAKEPVTIDDFNFSIHKIEKTNENWINTLFQQYRDDLEALVAKGDKKRIFQKDEKINLSPSTIRAIVEMIESFNLRSVEDDINGKVFETFLEFAVRGKELGQFFTPRSVVKFMVRLAELKIKRKAETGEYEPGSILDGSCGTGGFLIFALSDLFDKIPQSHSNKETLKKKIREDSLFGVDASEDDIVPITRMNMYLHGDGGSHIFLADTLDKELLVEKGLERERQAEIKELKELLENRKFDVVLTNPPFSMKYEQSKTDEKRVLEQYAIASLGGSLARSLKSNLMFLERYHDLLKPGGKLLTVIDESVLNTEGQGKSMQKFREWLRKKYIVRAVISLPHNTFVSADAGVKTSVLYLTKRVSSNEEQPLAFMAISKDVGHNDAGRITSEWGDLGNILESSKNFKMAITKLQTFENNPLTFGVILTESDDRLDCAWFNPIIENKINTLRKNKRRDRKLVKLKIVADVNGGKRLPKGTVIVESEANTIPYIRATDVKNLRVNLDTAVKIPKEVHQKIQNYQLQQNDVVITIVGTIGGVGILEEKIEVCDFTENIAKVRINDGSILPRFILHFLDSQFGKMQTERFSVGSLQYKLSLRSCRNIEIYLPYNENGFSEAAQRKILDEAYKLFEKADVQKRKGGDLIKKARSVVVEKLKIPLPNEKSDTSFTQELEDNPVARLDALFNNPVREKLINNLKKHTHKELGKLTKPQGKEDINPADFYSLVELEQIDEETGRIISAQEVPELGSEKILLKANSILIAKLQPEKGKVVIVPQKYDGSVGSSELVPLLLESTDVSLKYLWAVLRSDYVLKQWGYELTGSSRMRVGSTELKQTIVPIPDKKVQEEIVINIDEMVAESDKILREAEDLFEKAKEKFITAVIN